MQKHTFTAFVFFLIMSFSISAGLAQDASQWRGPDRNGIYPDKGLLEKWPEQGPDLLWHYDDLGPGHGSAAVTDSLIYVSGVEDEKGFVIAFEYDGKIRWKNSYGDEWMESYDGVRTTPAIVGDSLYILSGYGLLTCMHSKTGDILWQVDILQKYGGENIKWGITENLLIYDDKVICTLGGPIHNMIALNRFNGELIWSCPGKGEISAYNSPTLIHHNGRKIVIGHSENSILGVDAEDGTLLWTYDQPNKWSVHANTPLYHEGRLYVVTGYGKGGVMLELNDEGTSVSEVWIDENLDNKLGGVVLMDGRIYGSGDFKRSWFCLDWESGELLYSTKELKKGNIIAADGLLYWYSQSGDIALVRAEEDRFQIISQFEVPFGKDQHWAHLVIHHKNLFVRHGTSLMVYNLADVEKIAEWRGPGRSGVYENEKNLLKEWPEAGPELLWYQDSLPKGYSSLVVYKDRIYTTGIRGDKDCVVALDSQGELLWESPFGRKWDSSYDLSRCTPTVYRDRIFVSSGLGDVACLDAKEGKVLWQVAATDKYEGEVGRFGLSESLLLVDSLVLYTPGGKKTTMIALHQDTGEEIWTSPSLDDKPSYTSPLLVDYKNRKMVITTTKNYLIGINPQDGSFLYTFNIGEYAGGKRKTNNQTNTPLFKDGQIFFTSGYDHKSLLLELNKDMDSLSLVWVDSLLDVHHGGVVEIEGYLYGANWLNNSDGNWTCLKWDTGEEMYSVEWENKGSIISADGMLYCYEEKKGNLGLVPVDPEKFQVVSAFQIPYGSGPHWSHPVIDDGKLYIRHGSAIMVYDIKDKN
jgi:outer membrane protein assembly factor BamB